MCKKCGISLILVLAVCLLFAQTAAAQKLIRRSSRHFVADQALPSRVEPLLTDVWDQYAPYNNLCPVDSTGERCVVGCVATAMSQVMHYWEWPMQGKGSYTYVDSLGTKLTLTADFASHTYDWGQMLDRYVEGNYTQAQADAVALLSLDCGIAVEMRYGSKTSGANSIRQPMALVNYFGYDCGMQFYFRDFYSLAEITLMLKQELAAGRPVLISGYNANGGHAYVLDGYDERDWFHICMGNPTGVDNNWTYLPDMVPNQPKWYDHDSPENGMNILQMFTIGIMPTYHGDATGIERHNYAFQYISAVVDSLKPEPVYERGKVNLTVHDLSNVGWNLHADSVSLMLKQGDDIVAPLYTYSRDFLLEQIDDTAYTDTLMLSIPARVPDGAYTIVPMYRDNNLQGGKEWREALTSTGTPNYLIARVKGKVVTLQSDTASTAYLTLEDINIPDHILNGTAPDFSITFKNHNTEMAGRFYLRLEPLEEDGKSFYLSLQGLTLMKDEVSTRRFHKSTIYAPKLGEYRLHVMYEANLFADELIELELPEEIIIAFLPKGGIEIAERKP
ncbi:MAG: C10 family peptidase [Bacteroidaceae bacterium]|nr:C10 family peptidase [Bacteroidaceae bacterium]